MSIFDHNFIYVALQLLVVRCGILTATNFLVLGRKMIHLKLLSLFWLFARLKLHQVNTLFFLIFILGCCIFSLSTFFVNRSMASLYF